MLPTSLKNNPRVCFAIAVAAVGLAVSFAMIFVGGPMARHLPGLSFHLAALFGAGIAGLLCASAFGHKSWRGWCAAGLGGVGMTLLGALIGAGLIWQTRFVISGPFLGLLAVVDAAESLPVVLIWSLCIVALHLLAQRLRTAGAFAWPGRRR